MSGPSDKAYDAALASVPDATGVDAILDAVHDPALGLDRSVRLGDVLDALRSKAADDALSDAERREGWLEPSSDDYIDARGALADFIAREFGGEA